MSKKGNVEFIVACRDENGIEEDHTCCIDINDNRITKYLDGSKLCYGKDFLKIGRCLIKIKHHNVFGGTWCFEYFIAEFSEFKKLLIHLSKSGWIVEEGSEKFDKWFEKLKSK